MMKKTIFLVGLLTLLIACNGKKQAKESQESTQISVGQAELVEGEFVLSQGDTIFYDDDQFRIVGTEGDYGMGYDFDIYNKKEKKHFVINQPGSDVYWYEQIYDKYLIIDSGTGTEYRGFIPVDMTNGNIVADITYLDDKGLVDGKFYYAKRMEELPEGVIPPKCPDMDGVSPEQFGYIEKWVFDFETLQSKSLKIYDCIYFQ